MSKKAIAVYMKNEQILQNFTNVLGDERSANSYITSVLVAVANNPKLQSCTEESIYLQAIRSASLGLSVDPALGHAYLVPFKGKCTFIPGYRGLHDLAVRTGRYRYINAGSIYEGQEVIENPITGLHKIEGLRSKGAQRIGWIGAFELTGGFAKTIYMTIEEIHEHKEKYSKGWDRPDSAWQTETPKMEKKTVMLQLLKWGPLNSTDRALLNADNGDVADIIEVPEIEILDVEDAPKPTAAEEIASLGYDVDKEPGDTARFTNAQLAKLVKDGIMPDYESAEMAMDMSELTAEDDYKTMSTWAKAFAGEFFNQSASVEFAAARANEAYRIAVGKEQ